MCGFCNVGLCVYVGFLMCRCVYVCVFCIVCVYVWILQCYLCVRACVRDFDMCECVYV